MKKLLCFLSMIIIICGCTPSMQMTAQECSQIGPNQGVIVGSVLVRGGTDLRHTWIVQIQGEDPDLKDFSIEVDRDGEEVVFVSKMPAGNYRFAFMEPWGLPGGGSFMGVGGAHRKAINVPFVVLPGKVIYIGRLVAEFPDGLISAFTKVSTTVEDAQEQTMASAEKTHGIQSAYTVLMGSNQ